MKITGTIWLQTIVEKIIKKHCITPDEVEQVFANKPQYRFLENGKIEKEDVYAVYGQTDAGRYITIIFILKFNSRALIITARDMDKKERKQYGK